MTAAARRHEPATWLAVLIAMHLAYLYGAFARHADLFGINALRGATPVRYAACAAIAVTIGAILAVWSPSLRFPDRRTATLLAVAIWPVFFLLRTSVLNQDGTMLTPKFERDVPLTGAFLTHDEVLEFFVHSRVWFYTHQWWGWSVVFSYQVVSCIAGSMFIYAVVRLAGRVAPARPWLFVAGAVSGAYMQLFFGDAENYTITAAIVVVYVIAACRFLTEEAPLWLPGLVLGIAICFHLEAGWLLPSLLFLFSVSWARRADLRDIGRSAGIMAVVIAGTFAYFHFHGLPIRRLLSSHAGHAARFSGVFAVGMPWRYYFDQLNLLLLLCPAVVMIGPIFVWQWRERDLTTRFLAVAAGSMLALQAVWKAQLGVFDDWNLYAIGGMLTAIFVWREMSRAADSRPRRAVAGALAATGWFHTFAWIIANHRHA